MNIVTLLFAIVTIGALIAVLILVRAYVNEYRAENEHERDMEEKELEAQEKLFESEGLNEDSIDRELRKEREKNN